MLKCVCRMEVVMLVRMRVLFLLLLVFSSLAIAGDKKKDFASGLRSQGPHCLGAYRSRRGYRYDLSSSEQDCSRGCREGIDEMGPVDASLGRPTRGFSHYRSQGL